VLATAEETGKGREEAEKAQEAAEMEMKEFVADNSLGRVTSEVLATHGSVADAVAAVIKERDADLAIVGTHGRSGVGKVMLGSIAQRIFATASCPVLSVSPRARRSWKPGGKLSAILYPSDFSAESDESLPHALSLAKAGGADLILLHASQSALLPEESTRLHRQLNELVPPGAQAWCRYHTFVVPGEPAGNIVKMAEDRGADFIVMAAHGGEGRFHVPLTTAYQVVAHAPCPVLRVRG
jgi:nucleotide-binding universal stress UspA family protein